MRILRDKFGRRIGLSKDRFQHIREFHPEMRNQLTRIRETLLAPQTVIRSVSDKDVELFYRLYESTPVGIKYLCVVVKAIGNYYSVLTAYFTDKVKRGESIWTEERE